MLFRLTRVITKYGWDSDANESRKFEISDDYDPMEWDDIISNIGHLVIGHKDEIINIKIKVIKEEE